MTHTKKKENASLNLDNGGTVTSFLLKDLSAKFVSVLESNSSFLGLKV